MAGSFPIYTSREQPSDGRTPIVGPIAAPNLPTGSDVAAAGEQLSRTLISAGDEFVKFRDKMNNSQDETRALQARTGYVTKLNELREKYEQDPDYQTAPKRFKDERLAAEQEALGGIRDDKRRASAQMHMRIEGLSAQRHVATTATKTETDVNTANLDTLETESLKAAANAITPVERGDAVARHAEAVQGAAKAGWINETTAVARIKRFATALDITEVQRGIRDDPAKTAMLLDDPKNFPNIDPVQREQWRNAALSGADTRTSLGVVASAPYNPGGAIATTGRLPDPSHARMIFDRGVIPAEAGERDGVALVSPKGALGVSQIMPDTAREVAARLAVSSKDPAIRAAAQEATTLSDDDLIARLKSNRNLNYQLGLTYWNEQAARYQGNIPVMAAAYNAGPGKADEWLKKATDKFGPDFTAAQFQSVVTYKETREYIGNVYTKLGGELTAGGLSPEARMRASQQIGAKIAHEEAERIRVIRDIATSDRLTQDPRALRAAGMTPDTAGEALFIARQLEAARAGDPAATKALMELAETKRLEPMVRQAYVTAPVQLDQIIAAEEARLTSAPSLNLTTGLQEKNTLDALRAVRDEVKKRKDSDPVTLGARAGLYVPVAIDPQGNPGDPAWRATLNTRGAQALSAQKLYQGTAAPFMPQEAAALKERWNKADEQERFGLLQAFGETLSGPARDAALEQIGAGNAERIAANFSARPDLARAILHGSALLNDKDFDKKSSVVREALRVKLGGEIYPSPAMQHDVETAALAVYANDRGAASLYDAADGAGIEKAIEKVTGTIVRRNGRQVPAPPGVTAGAFEGAIAAIDQRALDAAGGAYNNRGLPMDPGDVARRSILRPLSPGGSLYVVMMPTPDGRDAPVMTYDAGPLVLNATDLVKRYEEKGTVTRDEHLRRLRDLHMRGGMLQ